MNQLDTDRCLEPSALSWPLFGEGMLLKHNDLTALTGYTQELNRLMFRSLLGCGVVCGLKVKAKKNDCDEWEVTVSEGLAISCSGDPIHVPKSHRLPENCDPQGKEYWVTLCRSVKTYSPRSAICSPEIDGASSVSSRARACYEIKITTRKPDACGCVASHEANNGPDAQVRTKSDDDSCCCPDSPSPCYKDHYEGNCTCGCGHKCDSDCVVLARVYRKTDERNQANSGFVTDHSVRRFIRPVFMCDPAVKEDKRKQSKADIGDDETKATSDDFSKANISRQLDRLSDDDQSELFALIERFYTARDEARSHPDGKEESEKALDDGAQEAAESDGEEAKDEELAKTDGAKSSTDSRKEMATQKKTTKKQKASKKKKENKKTKKREANEKTTKKTKSTKKKAKKTKKKATRNSA